MRVPLRARLERARTFLGSGIWEARPRDLPRHRALGYRLLRVSSIVAKDFAKDRCKLHASALTYTTLVSIVPLLAFAFAVAKGLKVQDRLVAPGGPIDNLAMGGDVARLLIDFVNRTDVTTLGALGLVILMWTVVQVLSTIESTFNDIWGVKQQRALFRKIADYISVLVITPVLLSASVIMTGSMESSAFLEWMHRDFPRLAGMVQQSFKLIPYAAMWVAFTGFYLFMPNTKVPFRCALGGGIVAGTAWQAGQWFFVHGNVLLAQFSPVYASFALVPAFLAWVYLSWMIALFGAEVAFALQHEATYHRETRAHAAGAAERERLALQTAGAVADRFRRGEPPWDVDALADAMDLPVRLVQDVGAQLEAGGILKILPGPVAAFHPARALETISLKQVLDAVRGTPAAPSDEGAGAAPAAAVMAGVDDAVAARLEGFTLDDFARGMVPGAGPDRPDEKAVRPAAARQNA